MVKALSERMGYGSVRDAEASSASSSAARAPIPFEIRSAAMLAFASSCSAVSR